jgi:hypothetical protein
LHAQCVRERRTRDLGRSFAAGIRLRRPEHDLLRSRRHADADGRAEHEQAEAQFETALQTLETSCHRIPRFLVVTQVAPTK